MAGAALAVVAVAVLAPAAVLAAPLPDPAAVLNAGAPAAIPGAVRFAFRLPTGTGVVVLVPSRATAAGAIPTPADTSGAVARAHFDPAPRLSTPAEAGSIGGGAVQPLLQPMGLRLETEDPAQRGQMVELQLPLLARPTQPGASFRWFMEVREGGQFAGYLPMDGDVNPFTSTAVYTLPISTLDQGTPGAAERGVLFLPAVVAPAAVGNHDAGARIWSTPFRDAVDFGVAAPQFTTFRVVGPQVGSRIQVHNPHTANYGWIDATGVGPVPLPAGALSGPSGPGDGSEALLLEAGEDAVHAAATDTDMPEHGAAHGVSIWAALPEAGSAGELVPAAQLQVVGPRVGRHVLAYDHGTERYGWIDAPGVLAATDSRDRVDSALEAATQTGG